jgi:hypothetical protein
VDAGDRKLKTGVSDLYFGTIDAKLALAHEHYTLHAARFASDADLQKSAIDLIARADQLRQTMASLGMFILCSACGREPAGGCCSAEMANEADGVLFLINLVLGRTVVIQRQDDFECCFLGPTGCALLVKPIFCLNYNCDRIKKEGGPEKMAKLEQAAAALFREQLAMERMILQAIR